MMPSMELVRKIDMLQPELKEILYTFIEEIERDYIKSANSEPDITEIKIALNDLQSLVKELSEAQKETEERLQKLIKEYELQKSNLNAPI
jgi:pantothenate kinase